MHALHNFTGADATGAHTQAHMRVAHLCADALQVHFPAPFGHVVRVADFVAGLGAFFADLTDSCHDVAPETWFAQTDFPVSARFQNKMLVRKTAAGG